MFIVWFKQQHKHGIPEMSPHTHTQTLFQSLQLPQDEPQNMRNAWTFKEERQVSFVCVCRACLLGWLMLNRKRVKCSWMELQSSWICFTSTWRQMLWTPSPGEKTCPVLWVHSDNTNDSDFISVAHLKGSQCVTVWMEAHIKISQHGP